jgi:SAM-dependent MidA family methyltransferase
MQTGNPVLIELIASQIAERGPMTFRDFMAQALYHPEHGYYASGRAQIGRGGDFFTNVSVGPIFGKMLSYQFCEIWKSMGQPARFTIVEQGAHDGKFAADVLTALLAEAPELAAAIDYCIVEPSPALRRKQEASLCGFAGVRWCDSLESVEPFEGVHFSNELVDAMPVHLLRKTKSGWREQFVDWQDESFVWRELEVSSSELHAAARKLPELAENYHCEINLDALNWIDEVGRKIRRGFLLTLDYGFARDELYAPHRTAGTIRTISNHEFTDDPLKFVGEADITAHVNFTALVERGCASGMKLAGFADQHHFLAGLLQQNPTRIFTEKERRGLQTLLNPTFLGTTFKVLALQKCHNHPGSLPGFAHPMTL